MAMNWSFVFLFSFGLITTLSIFQTIFRFTIGRDDNTFTEIVSKHGYISEEHTVETEDGYLLSLFRITQSPKCEGQKAKSPVLVINGLLASADCFLDAGLENGLPYAIADNCYDVWLGNARGTYYGRKHKSLDPDTDQAFWDFSVDEIGKYDVPATIDYVLNSTGVQQLNYIGISQGSGSFFVMCSERPEYSDKVKVLIGLAPASKHTHAKSLLFRKTGQLMNDYRHIYENFGVWEIMWKGMLDPIRIWCNYRPQLCYSLLALLDSPHPGSFEDENLKKAMLHFPAGTSVKNLARYGQSVAVDRYCKFDYGVEKNLELYGEEIPPEFNLSNVRMPTYFLHGQNDGIVDTKDMEWLVSQLPNVKEFVVIDNPLFNHLDVVLSKHLSTLVFPKIFEFLQIYNNDGTSDVISYSNDTGTITKTLDPVGLVDQLISEVKK